MSNKEYDIISDKPVARFYYQGQSHTHPVRRTVLIIEDHANHFVGYEMREGSQVRSFESAPVKTYRKDRIAKYGDYCRLRQSEENRMKSPSESTLVRAGIGNILKYGA